MDAVDRAESGGGCGVLWSATRALRMRAGCACIVFVACAATTASAVDLPGKTSARLGWTAATGPVTGYRVYVSRNGSVPTSHEQSVTATEAVVSGATGDAIEVWVRATGAGGALGAASPRSETLRFTAAITPGLEVTPTSVAHGTIVGTDAPARTITIRNTGAGTLGWSVADDASWLLATPGSGVSTGELDAVSLVFDTDGLGVGRHTATVTVTAPGASGSPRTIPVTLDVGGTAALGVSVSEIVRAVASGHRPTDQVVTVRNAGSGSVGWTVASGVSWLVPTPASGTSSGESDAVSLRFVTEGLDPGPHVTTLRFRAPGLPEVAVPVTVRVRPPTGDVDGDGASEAFLWGPAGGMAVYSHPLEPSATLAGFVQSGSPGDWVVLLSGDFDRDGRSDLLWRHRSSGSGYVCLMDGATFRACGAPLSIPANRIVLGAGDLDADGRADVSFRNPSSGAVESCFMNGLAAPACVTIGSFPIAWQVFTSGDWDADGRADVLAYDPAGALRLCPVQSRVIGTCTVRSAPAGQKLVGLGDYDGDGGADLLWHRKSDDRLLLGYPDGSVLTVLGTVPDDVEIVASLDYDRNGTSEVSLRRPADGVVTIWKTAAGGVVEVFDFGPIGLGLTLVGSSPVQ